MKQVAGISLIILYFGLVSTLVFGYVMNIVKLFALAYDPITTIFILRAIGIFVAPFGAILGFL